MPFKSTSQIKKCFALKRRNPRSTWNCKEWMAATKNPKRLPKRVKKRKARS
jgi:hypothetical protein